MKSIEGLFPWVVIGISIVLFNFGLWGIIGGIIIAVGTMTYLYKNDRKAEFKIVCTIFGLVLVTCIVFFILNISVTPHTITTSSINH